MKKMLICDSESDSFKYESSKIWVICCYDTVTHKFVFSFDESVDRSILYKMLTDEVGRDHFTLHPNHASMVGHMNEESVCFHNLYQHDLPLIRRFYPEFNPKDKQDSYILSQLFNPDRGLHGLDAWAKRIRGKGDGKVVHEEWDRFSPEMLGRVVDDVRINAQVWDALMEEKKAWEDKGESWDEAIRIEYGVADLQGRQELHGVLLDEEKAYQLADEILLDIQAIDEELDKELPMRVIRGSEVMEPFKKDGNLKQVVLNWYS